MYQLLKQPYLTGLKNSDTMVSGPGKHVNQISFGLFVLNICEADWPVSLFQASLVAMLSAGSLEK